MAIVVSNVTKGGTWLTSTNTTGSITTVTGQLYFTYIYDQNNSTASISNSLGISWTQIGSTISDSYNPGKAYLFYGVCTSGATGTFTITYSSTSGGQYNIDTCTGASSTPIVQTVTSSTGITSPPISITLSAFGSSNNGAYACWIAGGTSVATPSFTSKAGWTTVTNNYVSTSISEIVSTEYIGSNDTTPNEGFSTTWGPTCYGWAVEIAVPIVTNAYTTTVINSLAMMGCGI